MKIKIKRCNDSMLWYINFIGQEFFVVKVANGAYWCREKDEYKAINFVRKEDAEVIEESIK